jgi:hypothetical protein
VPRRAHRDAQGMLADADLERLFSGQPILLATQLSVVPFGDLSEINTASFAWHVRGPRDTR